MHSLEELTRSLSAETVTSRETVERALERIEDASGEGARVFLDGCAISFPCHSRDSAPVGFMLIGQHGMDHELFSASLSLEEIFNSNSEE